MLSKVLKDLIREFSIKGLSSKEASSRSAGHWPQPCFKRGGQILAFVPESEGDALKQHTLEMLNPLDGKCDAITIIDFSLPAWQTELRKAIENPIWFAMAPFGAGEQLTLEGVEAENVWADAQIPFVRLFGDTPAYFPSKHIQRYRTSINAYGHPEHQDFHLRWFQGTAPTVTLPLFPIDRIDKNRVDFRKKAKDARIIFPKNGNCPNQLIDYWETRLPPSISKILTRIAHESTSNLDAPSDLANLLIGQFSELAISIEENKRLFFFLIAQLDDYLRRRKSTLIARSILEYPVTIRGVNWDHINFSGKRARHDPDSDYLRTRALLDESMAVLDMSPNTHRGAHDRALRAAGRHTTFLTNKQGFYLENFEGVDRFTYSFSDESIRSCVESALSHPEDTVEIGIQQAKRMNELLTTEYYCNQLITAVDACALGCAGRPAGTQIFVDYRQLQL